MVLSLWRSTSDQRGAYNRVVAPDYLVRTILEVSAAGVVQHKFVGDPDAISIDPHATFRQVTDKA